MKTPAVAFDARMAGHPGIGRYIRSLLGAMLKRDPAFRWILIGQEKDLTGVPLREGRSEFRPCSVPIYGLEEQRRMPSFFEGADLVHVPHFNAPWRMPAKCVVTIHDLIYFRVKEYEPFWGARFFLDLWFRRLARGAARIIAVSEATRRDFESRFGAKEKITVIPEAAAPVFFAQSPDGAAVRKKWDLPGRYVLFVGSIREHKNVQGLLRAYARIREKTDAGLVLVGRVDPRFEARHRFREAVGGSGRIRWIPEASDEELGALYRAAACFVLPSFYEGFGLPVLEAMASGTPVIAADSASLAEVTGEAGLLFKPEQIDRLSELLYNVLSDSQLRQTLSQKGRLRAKAFSWEEAARRTLALYEEVL